MKNLLLYLFICVVLSGVLFTTIIAQAGPNLLCGGKVTEWVDGKEKPLSGAIVIVGKNISLKVGSDGRDILIGKVTAKIVTDSSGYGIVSIPTGIYNVIIWKAGYVPKTYHDIESKNYEYLGSISKDTSMQGLHLELIFKEKN